VVKLYRGVDELIDDFTPKSFEGDILKGRWWSEDPTASRKYAQGLLKNPKPQLGGVVYSMDVDPGGALSKSTKFKDKLISKGYDFLDNPKWDPNVHLATKELIKEGAPKINWGQTALTNLETLGSKGLGFLKNNALRTLAFLGSLPAQVGIMTLSPTMMGNAELSQMPQGSPTQINQGGGGGNGGTGGNAGGADLSSGMTTGQHAAFRMNNGGLIDLYRYGGFI
tara:strand:+ start:46 stop:717 length:672 start_codon:yes stop_codon:yes gene_type:complete